MRIRAEVVAPTAAMAAVLAVLAALVPTVAAAQAEALRGAAQKLQWRVSPRISVTETLTDNVFLEPSGEEDWDLVTRVSPGVSVVGSGNRLQLNFNATAHGLHYIRHSGSDDTFILLDGTGNLEVLEDHFFVDAELRRSRELASLSDPISIDDTLATGNRTTATVLSLSPYLLNRYGDIATSELRYTHRRAWYDSGAGDEGYTNRYSASLDSGEAFSRLFWGLDANHEVVEQEDERDAGTFSQGSATLGYRLTRHLSVSATGGYEDNDYETFRDTVDGAFWNAGFRWVPTRRTTIAARYGERFFGNTGSLQVTHRRRTTLWQVSYTESVQSTRELLLEQVGTRTLFIDADRDGVVDCGPSTFDPVANPDCLRFDLALVAPQLVDDFFIAELWRASVTAFGPRQSLTLAYTDLHRTFERDGAEEDQIGVTLSYRLGLGQRTHFTADTGWARNELVRRDRTDTLWHVRAGLDRELNESATAGISVRHQRRSSDEEFAEYKENAIVASFSYRF